MLEKERREEMRLEETPDVEKIKDLQKLKSIGDVSSWVTVRELFGWRKFKNAKEVGFMAGYC
jgi:hypothetical protein